MPVPRPLPAAVLAILLVTLVSPAPAQWTSDASVNLSLADRSGEQVQPKVRATADGGAYVSWYDNSTGGYDVTVQRVDGGGVEQWAHDGVLVANRSFSSTQDYGLDIDAAGHAVIAFRDDRPGGVQITAARVAPDGTQPWGAAGVVLTSGSAFHGAPKIAGTSDGDIVVAWTNDADVRLQRLDADGVPQWGAGITLSDASGGSYLLADMHSSDDGAVIVSWNRESSFLAPKHIYTQKLDADGTPLWNGGAPVVVFDGGSLQFGNFPKFVPDGTGGAVFGWYSNSPSLQCWVQRVRANGTTVTPSPVVASTNGTRIRVNPSVAFDPATESTLLAWVEQNGAQSQFGLWAQCFDASGARTWTDEGRMLVALGAMPISQVRTSQDAGEAIIFFVDTPSDERVRATRLDTAGDAVFDPPFVDVCSLLTGKSRLAVDRNDDGMVIATWQDARAGAWDIYAQNLNVDGTIGPRTGDIDGDGDIDFTDLLTLLAAWGACPEGPCPADLDGNGTVNFADLLILLAGWG